MNTGRIIEDVEVNVASIVADNISYIVKNKNGCRVHLTDGRALLARCSYEKMRELILGFKEGRENDGDKKQERD